MKRTNISAQVLMTLARKFLPQHCVETTALAVASHRELLGEQFAAECEVEVRQGRAPLPEQELATAFLRASQKTMSRVSRPEDWKN